MLLCSIHMLSFYICLEASSFSIFLLSISGSKTIPKVESTVKYFIITSISSSIILLSISLIYLSVGFIDFYHLKLYYFTSTAF